MRPRDFFVVSGRVLLLSLPAMLVNQRLVMMDAHLLLAIAGGFVTALFSVGIGELVGLYLFIRHYPVLLCPGTACVISSVSMILGSIWHVGAGTVQWEVVLLAAPAAVLGGFLARPIALGSRRLKTLVGGWIVLSALDLVWINAG
ncbi:MAG: TSUP family transporter [Sphingomonadaceae bacterium]|nr:TSUP family transporter [Sphingomonadaceae bacterium]